MEKPAASLARHIRLIRALFLFATLNVVAFAQDEPDPARGKEVFKMCSACHSTETDQRKMGPSLRTLYGKVLLRNGKRTTDTNVRELVLEGFNGMPPYKNMLRPGEIDHLVAYLKTLKGRPVPAAAPVSPTELGASVFSTHCARCHGSRSVILNRAGDLRDLFTREQLNNGNPVTEFNVLILIDDGHGGAPKYRNWLDRESRKALVEYLRLGPARP